MANHIPGRAGRLGPLIRAARVGLLALGALGVLVLGVLLLIRCAPPMAAGLSGAGPLRATTPDQVIGWGSQIGAGLLLTWLGSSTSLAVLSAALSTSSTWLARLAGATDRLLVPVALRAVVTAVVGGSLAVGGAAGAWAQQNFPDPGWAVTSPAGPRALPPAPPRTTRPAAAIDRPNRAAGHDVIVRPGDTLWGIAARQLGDGAGRSEITREWHRWYAANRTIIGPDPDQLRPGQRLSRPRD